MSLFRKSILKWSALSQQNKGDVMVSLDLKDAYFSVPIFPPDRRYLRFVWKNRIFKFTCLPFGNSLAPRVFTKVLKPFISTLRFRGIRIFIFIDDILLMAKSELNCLDHLGQARSLGVPGLYN